MAVSQLNNLAAAGCHKLDCEVDELRVAATAAVSWLSKRSIMVCTRLVLAYCWKCCKRWAETVG